jgi:hypothetical protein
MMGCLAETKAFLPNGVDKGNNPALQEVIYILCIAPDKRLLMFRRGFRAGVGDKKIFIGPWSITISKRLQYGYKAKEPITATKSLIQTFLNLSEKYINDSIVVTEFDSFKKGINSSYRILMAEFKKKVKITLDSVTEVRAINEINLAKLMEANPNLFSYETRIVLIEHLNFVRNYL